MATDVGNRLATEENLVKYVECTDASQASMNLAWNECINLRFTIILNHLTDGELINCFKISGKHEYCVWGGYWCGNEANLSTHSLQCLNGI